MEAPFLIRQLQEYFTWKERVCRSKCMFARSDVEKKLHLNLQLSVRRDAFEGSYLYTKNGIKDISDRNMNLISPNKSI